MTWPSDVPQPVAVTLFTNRNVLAFNRAGVQITEVQTAIGCYAIDQKVVADVADLARSGDCVLKLSKFREWEHDITWREWLFLLGFGITVAQNDQRT